MAEFRDRDWDERYENFKLLKEKRKQLESDKSNHIVTGGRQNEILNKTLYGRHGNETDVQNEKKTFMNKGQSRFLKAHSISSSTGYTLPSSVTQSVDNKENGPRSQEFLIVKDENKEKPKLSFMDVLPYIFIVFGILIIMLILIKVI